MKPYLLQAAGKIQLWMGALLLQIDPIGTFIEKYLFADLGFLKWLSIAMFIDLITGIGKSVKRGESITSRGLRDTVSKCIQYGGFLIITHIVTHFEVGGQAVSGSMQFINGIAYKFIMMIEVWSVYENIIIINPKLDIIKKTLTKLRDAIPSSKSEEKA